MGGVVHGDNFHAGYGECTVALRYRVPKVCDQLQSMCDQLQIGRTGAAPRLRKRGLSLRPMSATPDLAQICLQNALVLFDEFVRNTIKHPDAATLRGPKGVLPEWVGIQPSYWSQIKSRAPTGERLARQFEQQYEAHGLDGPRVCIRRGSPGLFLPRMKMTSPHAMAMSVSSMGLVLTYYRRHPNISAPASGLDLLGEVLSPAPLPALMPGGPLPRRRPLRPLPPTRSPPCHRKVPLVTQPAGCSA